MGLLERGLHGAAKKLVSGGRNNSKVTGKAIGRERRVITHLLGWCHCFERLEGAFLFLTMIERRLDWFGEMRSGLGEILKGERLMD